MNEILQWSASRMAAVIREKQISAEELMQIHLERIAEVNPKINAVFALDAEAALQAAREADRELALGQASGPLQGVPFSVKDWIEVAGLPCAGAETRYLGRVPRQDATVVARLRGAGGLVLGKTAVLEESEAYGRVHNPYHLGYSPTGSSSGEAALIAAGGSPVGLGSDSGGSIRQPAHACGIAGLKPSSGRVPLSGHFPPITPLSDPRTVIGPLARWVEDLALVLPILAGPDWRDASVVAMPLEDYRRTDLSRLRVAFYTRHQGANPTAETVQTVQAVTQHLSQVCALVEEQLPPRLEEVYPITRDYWSRAESSDPEEWKPQGQSKLSGDQVARHLFEWDRFRRWVLGFMQNWDIILTPAAELPAQPHGTNAGSIAFTLAYSLTGYPAGVVRSGTAPDGMPIGVQVVGRPWRDDQVLAVMREIEQAFGGWQAPPLD